MRLLYAILALLLTATGADAQIAKTYSAGSHKLSVGFTRNWWVPTLNCMLTDIVGDGNDVQCFNPVTDTWVTIFQNDAPTYPNGAAGYRDNQSSFYNANRKELWIWNGSHMERNATQDPGATGTVIAGPTTGSDGISRYNVNFTSNPPRAPDGWTAASNLSVVGSAVTVVNQTTIYDDVDATTFAGPVYPSGRLYIGDCEPVPTTGCANGGWVWRSKSQSDMDSTLVKNNVSGFGADPGCAWNSTANAGICGFAFNGANAQNIMVVEPNTGSSICSGGGTGAQVYISCEISSGTHGIPARVDCMGCMASGDGSNVYIYGGKDNLTDLWRYNLATHTLTQLKSSPARGNWSFLTYDSGLNKLVVWTLAVGDASSMLLTYDITGNAWSSHTVAGQPCIGNNVGVYAPTVKSHVYEGGGLCGAGDYNNTYGIAVDGSTVAGLSLQHRAWTRVALPTSNSPFTPGGGTKQWQVVFRPANNEMYFLGGDGGPGIHINGTYSVNLASNSWTLRVPQCVTPPDVEPGYLTEDAIALDTTRDLIYWPGGGHLLSENLQLCAPTTDAAIMREPAMALNLTTNKWSVTSWPGMIAAGINATEASQDAVYDPVTDQMLQVYSCTGGMCAAHFHPNTETWESVSLACAANTLASQNNGTGCTPRSYINSGFSKIENHYMAIDPVGRKFYFRKQSDGNYPGVLVAYDIDARTATIYDFPTTTYCSQTGTTLPECWNALSWDSANNVLLWFSFGTSNPNDPPCPHAGSCYTASEIFAFTPATGTWASIEKFSPTGDLVQGATVGYDPTHNAHVLIGGAFPEYGECPTCSFYSYYFLYRYAANTNPQATILVQSTTPNSLVPMTLTPADVNGQTGGNTPFQRTWNIADKIVAVFVAAATSQGAAFSFWTGCDSVSGLGGSTCHVDATTNRTITANYATLGQRVGFGGGVRLGGSVQIGN